jgi:hypothetical protein
MPMWYPNATNKQILHNFTRGGMNHPLHGIVLHIMDGTLEGTYGWFNKTVEQRQADFDAQWEREGRKTAAPITAYASSAHFGNAVDGRLWQFLDTDHQAWAQGPGNPDWISIENEGHGGDELSDAQKRNIARLIVWMLETDSVPLQVANSPSEYGLGFHSMSAGWGHPMCPGSNIIRQRDAIVTLAGELLAEDIRAIRSQSGPFHYEMPPREVSVE